MTVFIALYRGINVGGRNAVKMESLRAMHERLGHRGVRNYIQTGNLVFSAAGTGRIVAQRIAAEFADEFGFAAKVVVVDAKGWEALVRGNPYAAEAAADPKTVHAAVCAGAPDAAGLTALLVKTGGRERFEIAGETVYLHAPDGFGTSKFAAGMEKAAGVSMTVRNWRTVEALQALAFGLTSPGTA